MIALQSIEFIYDILNTVVMSLFPCNGTTLGCRVRNFSRTIKMLYTHTLDVHFGKDLN